jgi:hypothetical protein
MKSKEFTKITSLYNDVTQKYIQNYLLVTNDLFKLNLFWTITKSCSTIVERFNNLSKDFNTSIQKKLEIEKQIRIEEKKNFFSSIISYKLERFHSELLRLIIDPKTEYIGNIDFLKIFLNTIKISNLFEKEIFVKTEEGNNDYGYIDIIIHDDNYAIIIENKINGAIDQPNQLARYYLYVENVMKKEVIAIVYIPYFGEVYGPDFTNYSGVNLKYVKNIKEKLVILPTKDLLDIFLKNCLNKSNNDAQSLIIGQYSNLLDNILGGKNMDIEKGILRELLVNLFSKKENIDQVRTIAELWNRRQEILSEQIWELLSELDYEPSDDGSYLRFKCSKNVEIAFHMNYSRATYYNPLCGFYSADKFKELSEAQRKCLNDLINETFSERYYSRELVDWGKEWIAKEIQMDNCNNIEELRNETIQKFAELKEKIKSKIVA